MSAIESFWAFWAENKAGVEHGITHGGLSQELIDGIGRHVAGIDPSLDWELGPGRSSKHHLCLSGKGDPVLRVVAARWLAKAPPACSTWEYYAARQSHRAGGLRLNIAGNDLSLDDLALGVREDTSRERLDVVVFHPAFAAMPEDLRRQIAFIGLDTTLAEDDVERWIGAVDVTVDAPQDPVLLPALRDRVSSFARSCNGEKWAVLKGEREGKRIVVTTNLAIKRVEHLLFDTHVALEIPLHAPTPDGLTTNEEADVLNALEDQLLGRLGGDAIYLGRETCDGARTLHLHVMESGPAAASIEAFRASAGREVRVAVTPDPRWDVLGRWG